ncbi:cryptochrome/photolyase family protein [Thalassotalea ponticola]|uniref:cryptochrome/photolyase family protein n=1 Tax=Thalassotalea ponticola TaxID=1523392 RepID=UPI0025B33AF0|nr:cryptochrome/photolyase family protein [Thalassotalea ponticola]MDN3651466.1 cryptochrome/photolyase family protein [Thalassotalea ponticola]
MQKFQRLRLILGDQLNANHSWYKHCDPQTLYVIAELRQETDYVCHHIQKLCAFFAAMNAFANSLQQAGHSVLYLTLDDTAQYPDLPSLINALLSRYQCKVFEYQQPDELRLLAQLSSFKLVNSVVRQQVSTEHFLLDDSDLTRYFKAETRHRLESFYRNMRKRFNILMDNGQPTGGTWNYDQNNRQTFKANDIKAIPQPLLFANPVNDIIERIDRHQVASIGQIQGQLLWPINQQQSNQLLAYFCSHCLPRFGTFQDAMTSKSPHQWSLYHSRLSFALNCKMLHPMQVIEAAISAHRSNPEAISLAQIEGFVRQILGWREFIRGIYWANGDSYKLSNTLFATRDLPAWFWTGKTHMQCMRHAINQSLEFAYAHHIQRLMITGNFALLTGIHPDLVEAWYLGIYIDAIEWVEQPNTRGMALFADNGLLASKPYAASGNYINKMSDYCTTCKYDVKTKTEANSCPFNAFYWYFLQQHEQRFNHNPRMAFAYKNWQRLSTEQRRDIIARADYLLDHIEQL